MTATRFRRALVRLRRRAGRRDDRLRLQRAVRLLLDHRRDAAGEHDHGGGDDRCSPTRVAAARRRSAFGGGEPTIRRGLLPLVRWCRDRGYRSIKVPSNGSDVLVSRVRGGGDRRPGSTDFHISFMAHTAGALREHHGQAGAPARSSTQGVRNLIDARAEADRRPDHQERHLDAPRRHRRALGGARHRDVQPLAGVAVRPQPGQSRVAAAGERDARRNRRRLRTRPSRSASRCRSRHIPRCMLPGYEEHVADLREDNVLVVTPRTTFALWESRISPNTYGEKCEGCRLPAAMSASGCDATTSSATATAEVRPTHADRAAGAAPPAA